MNRSRRSRLRRSAGRDRSRTERGAGGGRPLVLALLASILLAAGYGLGRWSALRVEGEPSMRDGAPPAVREAAVAAPVVETPGVPEEMGVSLAGSSLESELDVASHPSPAAVAAVAPPSRAPIAIVIDDLGGSLEVVDELRGFGVPMSYAVLPFEPNTAAVAGRLSELDLEILCHLPMEARRGEDPGPGALVGGMSRRQLRASTRRAIAAVPGARGVNNHMGSALSEDPVAMDAVLDVVRAEGLFFLDSRTSAASLGYRMARELGVPAVERKVFLDGDRAPDAIRREFRRLLALADGGGAPAVAIGHPYQQTIEVLADEIPRAVAQGYRFVEVSSLLETEHSARRLRIETE